MNSSILFVVLMIFVKICKPEDEPNTTVIVQDTRTEMTIQEFDDPLKRSRSDDYYDRLNEAESEDDDLDFDYDDGVGQDVAGKLGIQKQEKQTKEQLMQEALLTAMKKPAIKEQIGQVIPILRVMTPTQRLTLAALVSSQIMSHNGLNEANLTQIASMFAGKNIDNADDRHNVTEHLLLPISMDIAKMFRGLGREVGRNLRHDNIPPGPFNQFIIRTKPKRLIKRPFRTKPPGFNRRSDNHIPLDRNMTLSPLSPPPLPSPPPSQNLTPPSPPPTQSTLTTSMSSPSSSSFYNSSHTSPSSPFSPSPSPPTPSLAPVAEALKQPSIDDCEYFSNSLCLEVTNYPVDAILSSIKNQKNIMETLLADFKTQSADEMVEGVTSQQENKYQPQHYFSRANRRQDGQNNNEIRDFGAEGGYMCPSSVKYARPKRARTTQGDWKYIVNAGDYTQTLRLEMCLKPLASCSYVTDHFKSQCTQVFNYHRLLTWDEKKGLHMDIFKVPSCCSCHIQGYASLFPPNNDYTFAEKRREPLPVNEFPPPNPPQRPIFNNVGGKREVPRPIQQAPHSPTFHPQAPIQNQFRQPEPIQNQFRPQDPAQNLVDHLVPPGPPLPLDDRNTINNYNDLSLDASSYNKRGPVEYNRRHPGYHDDNRPHNRVVDRVEIGQPPDGSNYGSKVRNNKKPGGQQQQFLPPQQQNLPPQPPPPQFRPSLNVPQKPRIVLPTKLPQNTNPQYGNQQNRFTNFPANQNSPKSDVKTPRPDQSLFVTPSPNNELVIQPGSKPSPHQPVKYFNPDINEIPQQSKNPFLVTPAQSNKVVFKENDNSVYTSPPTTPTTTAKVPVKSETVSASGQKRVNYNYHPIIDFFTVESTSKASVSFPTPMNHEWTPVIGRSGA